MRLAHSPLPRLGLVIAGAAAALIGAFPLIHAASASATATAAPYSESVTVLAPEVVRRPVGTSRHGRGIRIEVASLAKPVSYADLDLTKSGDQQTFKDRIWSGARAACRQLNSETPSMYQAPTESPCAADAASEALKVADEVIAAANRA